MQPITYVLLATGFLAVIVFLIYRDSKGSGLATVLKTLASLFFIATAVVAFVSNVYDQAQLSSLKSVNVAQLAPAFLIVLGLVFGMVGDITLDLKIAYPKDDEVYTYAGMSSFGVGHILYIVALCSLFPLGGAWSVGYSIAIGVGLALIVIFGGAMSMGMGYGKYLIPSLLYACLLCTFTAHCIATIIVAGFSVAMLLLLIGSVFFLISDLILSMTYFQGKNSKLMIVTNHVTYYIAQFLIALSLGFIALV